MRKVSKKPEAEPRQRCKFCNKFLPRTGERGLRADNMHSACARKQEQIDRDFGKFKD